MLVNIDTGGLQQEVPIQIFFSLECAMDYNEYKYFRQILIDIYIFSFQNNPYQKD